MNLPTTEQQVDSPDNPFPTEIAAFDWLNKALEHQRFIQEQNPSRENSLAVTDLEQAIHWAQADLDVKFAKLRTGELAQKGEDLDALQARAAALDFKNEAKVSEQPTAPATTDPPLAESENPDGAGLNPEEPGISAEEHRSRVADEPSGPIPSPRADTAPTDPPASS